MKTKKFNPADKAKRRDAPSRDTRGRKRNTDVRDNVHSKSGVDSMLVDNRLKYVARLPMGRPFPPAYQRTRHSISGTQYDNFNATGVSRPSVRAIFGNTGGFDWDGQRAVVPPWVSRVSQHIYNKLRDEVRSNTPYSVADVTVYLAMSMNMLVYMQYVKRNLLATAQYDVRAPELWKMLVASSTEAVVRVPNKDYGTFESSRYYSDIKIAPAYAAELGDTWLNTAKLSGTLSYFCLPPRIAELLTEYIGAVHVENLDSQYDILKLGRKSFCYFDHATGLFTQFADESNPATQSFSASGLLAAISKFDEFISKAPVSFGTLIADMRRIGGLIRLIVEMPPEMGGAIPISTSPIFYAGMRNAYNYIPFEIGHNYNYEVEGELAFRDSTTDEVRINEVVSLDTTDGVGLSLVACFVRDESESGGTTRNARGLFVISHEEHMQYDDNSLDPDAFAYSILITPVAAWLLKGTAPAAFADIGLSPVNSTDCIAMSARSIIPSLNIMYEFPGDGHDYRTLAWDSDTSNGTRISIKMANEILDAFMETLFVA